MYIMTKALLVVDMQNDFCERGSLPVVGGKKLAKMIYVFIDKYKNKYDHIIASKDWHINPKSHFSKNPDFINSWPQHCRAKSVGAEFCKPIKDSLFEFIFYKGQYSAAYSAFEGKLLNTKRKITLHEWIQSYNVDQLDIVGIAADYCVKETAIDSSKSGLSTSVLLDLTIAIHKTTLKKAIIDMSSFNINLITSKDMILK